MNWPSVLVVSLSFFFNRESSGTWCFAFAFVFPLISEFLEARAQRKSSLFPWRASLHGCGKDRENVAVREYHIHEGIQKDFRVDYFKYITLSQLISWFLGGCPMVLRCKRLATVFPCVCTGGQVLSAAWVFFSSSSLDVVLSFGLSLHHILFP